ncbi:MAG TPA: MopE-related protein, partial [Parafilimonas sp.]|nr:MopE-related protein [Parafilimonas sp.]
AAINPATVWYKDADDDGYSDGTTQTQCERPSGYKLATELTATSRDCDDDNVAINPATVWYKDADDDGYSDGTTQTQCERPSGYKLATELIATSGDCNDGNAAINPGAVEICGNGIDDNCNGQIDENCVAVCQNATGLTTTNITATSAQLNWTATVNAVQWQVQYKTTNQGAKWMNVSSTLTGGNVRSVTISGLKSKQVYNWHIRAKCGKTWTSYSNAVKFKTLATGANAITISNASTNEKDNAIMKLYPNPTRGQFILELHVQNNINTKATLQLIDITGKTVQTENAEFNNGSLQRTVTLSQGLTQGIYMVRIVVNGTIYKTQFVYTK